ncbi:MAG: hypothetical protein P4L69_18975 [Desulfosporosinus sp.]|nr:hypothetical protein [Desulfosporosinus sp.]
MESFLVGPAYESIAAFPSKTTSVFYGTGGTQDVTTGFRRHRLPAHRMVGPSVPFPATLFTCKECMIAGRSSTYNLGIFTYLYKFMDIFS